MQINRAKINQGIHLINALPPVSGSGDSILGRHIIRYIETRAIVKTTPPNSDKTSH
jgi:hypothetical protein